MTKINKVYEMKIIILLSLSVIIISQNLKGSQAIWSKKSSDEIEKFLDKPIRCKPPLPEKSRNEQYWDCKVSSNDDYEKRHGDRPGLFSHESDDLYASCLKRCKKVLQK